jgi:monoamine oxidase
MTTSFSKYIIIGAGLSGLTSAYLLNKLGETDIAILESRDRIGGRILTKNAIDFGATWFQNHHQNVIDLLDDINVERFYQYSKGKSVLVYNTMAPAHYFENDVSTPSAYRVSGGTKAIIEGLSKSLQHNIKIQQTVTAINETKQGLEVITNNGIFNAEKVIITIPPRIATRIHYKPQLPEALKQVMEQTHTWMSNAIKVGLTFKTPFWRHKGFSGTLIGQVGAVTELYDHSNSEDSVYTLMGFVNEGLRTTSPEKRKKRILDHISKYLGDDILDYISYEEKDWSQDKHTACETINSVYMSPEYGNNLFQNTYMNGKLIFSGAETAPKHGGYMDGAILKGLLVVDQLLDHS